LSTQPDGVVLTYPFDADKALAAAAAKTFVFIYFHGLCFCVFREKTFLEDEINLDIMQYPWQERRKVGREFS
jgi:hypothetical protein